MRKVPDDFEDTLIMSVKLRSGRFESSIEVPLFADDDDKKLFVEKWLEMMQLGIKIGNSNRKQND